MKWQRINITFPEEKNRITKKDGSEARPKPHRAILDPAVTCAASKTRGGISVPMVLFCPSPGLCQLQHT